MPASFYDLSQRLLAEAFPDAKPSWIMDQARSAVTAVNSDLGAAAQISVIPAARFGAEMSVVQIDPDTLLVAVSGSLDIDTVHIWQKNIMDAFGEMRPRQVELDMDRVDFFDSIAVGVFVSIYTRIQSAGSKLVVRRMHPLVRRQLEVNGLIDYLQIEAGSEGEQQQ